MALGSRKPRTPTGPVTQRRNGATASAMRAAGQPFCEVRHEHAEGVGDEQREAGDAGGEPGGGVVLAGGPRGEREQRRDEGRAGDDDATSTARGQSSR